MGGVFLIVLVRLYFYCIIKKINTTRRKMHTIIITIIHKKLRN